MDQGSSDTYIVEITLVTEQGDLPSIDEVQDLIASQMGGELDEPASNGGTGLFCVAVWVRGARTEEDN